MHSSEVASWSRIGSILNSSGPSTGISMGKRLPASLGAILRKSCLFLFSVHSSCLDSTYQLCVLSTSTSTSLPQPDLRRCYGRGCSSCSSRLLYSPHWSLPILHTARASGSSALSPTASYSSSCTLIHLHGQMSMAATLASSSFLVLVRALAHCYSSCSAGSENKSVHPAAD